MCGDLGESGINNLHAVPCCRFKKIHSKALRPTNDTREQELKRCKYNQNANIDNIVNK